MATVARNALIALLKRSYVVFGLLLATPWAQIAAAQQGCFDAAQAATAAPMLQKAELRLANGRIIRLKVEVAQTPQKRICGLMFRKQMSDDGGMLFIFPDMAMRSFWMRNTLISLDIIYFDAQGRFVSVAENAIPLDETALPSLAPARFVLEINGGLAKKLGIGRGTQLRAEALAPLGLGVSEAGE